MPLAIGAIVASFVTWLVPSDPAGTGTVPGTASRVTQAAGDSPAARGRGPVAGPDALEVDR